VCPLRKVVTGMIVSELGTAGPASKGYSLLRTSECFVQHVLGARPYDIGIERGGGISDMRYCIIVSQIAAVARHIGSLQLFNRKACPMGRLIGRARPSKKRSSVPRTSATVGQRLAAE
jgi:hypothetical protein